MRQGKPVLWDQDQDGGAEHDEGGAEPAEVSGNREVDHLLDRVEVWKEKEKKTRQGRTL